jgi:hypothetical protein
MTSSFAALKKSRSSSFEQLNAQLQKTVNTQSKNNDDKYWKPDVDKAGNGYAVIRFLPAPEGEDYPFVKMIDHGFQGPGGWYIENSLATIGQEDPVSEFNSKLWNASSDDESQERKQARKQKRRTNFTSNIYVVKDSANPSNEGRVFLYKYGKMIMEKLQEVMNPQYEGDEKVNPFDMWEGADFKLKIRNKEGYRNYDRSEFSERAPITNPNGSPLDDERMEEIWKQQHSLKEVVDPKNFKTYAELKAKLYKVLGLDGSAHAPMKSTAEDDDKEMDFTPKFKERPAPAQIEASSPAFTPSMDDDEDTLDFFKSLAAGD